MQAELAVLSCGGNPLTVRERAHERVMSPELVIHACRQALNINSDFADHTAPFVRWDAIAPGCLDVRVFDQDRYWVDALGIPHRIGDRQDMTDDYLHALIGFLVDHADYMLRGYARYCPISDTEPHQWIESTVLLRGLRTEIPKRTT